MKKFFTLAFAMTFAMAAQAQNYSAEESATGGKLAVEVQVNPFSDDFNTFRLNENKDYKVPSIKLRYFLDDKNAIRLKLGLGINSKKTTKTNNTNTLFEPDLKNYEVSSEVTETKDKSTTFQIAVGYEHHFAIMKRLSIYGGGEIGFEVESFSGNKTANKTYKEASYNEYAGSYWDSNNYRTVSIARSTITDYTRNTTTEYKNQNSKGDLSNNAFFFNIFTGVDFQLYKGLYIGTELGLSFKNTKSKNGYYNETMSESGTINTVYNPSREGYNNNYITYTRTRNYNGETGVTQGLYTTNTDTTTPEPTYSGGTINKTETKGTSFKFYVEPAIRIGWRF